MIRSIVAATLIAATAAASAQSIRVREECGGSFFAPCGLGMTTLERNGPSVVWEYSDDWSFELAYVGDAFVMTALDDGFDWGSLFGLAVYRSTGPVITQAYENTTTIGWIPMLAFPTVAGQSESVTLPAVPEPATYALMLGGLAALACSRRRA